MNKSKKFLAVLSAMVILVSSLTFGYPAAMAASKKNIVKSMSVSSSSVTIKKGSSKTVKATVKASKKVAAADLKVTVKTSDKSVATVKVTKNPSKKGKSGETSIKITAKKSGKATITVTAKSLSTKKKTVKKTIKVTVPATTTPSTTKPTTAKPTTTTTKPTTKPTTTAKPFSSSDYTVSYETVEKTVKFKINSDNVTKEELIAQGYTVVGDEATRTCRYGRATFTFTRLPQNLDELKSFSLKSDVRTVDGTEIDYGMLRPAAASVLALHTFKATNRFDTSNPICDMLDYLNGPSTTTAIANTNKQFINGQLIDHPDLVNCYFQGATPANAYTPSTPYKIVVEEGPYYIPAKTTVNGNRPTTYMAFIKFAGSDEGERYIDVFKSSDGNWYSWSDQYKNLLASIKAPEEVW